MKRWIACRLVRFRNVSSGMLFAGWDFCRELLHWQRCCWELVFWAGISLRRYQAAHAPQLPRPVILSNAANGAIASVSGIVQTPNSELVQVKYNRLVPETVQGSLDDPQIRQLLLLGTKLATNNDVHADSVALLASECRAGHSCDGGDDGTNQIRATLVSSLRYRQECGGAVEGAEWTAAVCCTG